MLYSLLKPLLFSVDAELAHEVSLEMLQQFHSLLPRSLVHNPRKVMGLEFPNPVGLAAGLDKNADYLDGLARLGFGFIEVGSVTPRPQPGNPQPRLFRLRRQQSIINRMGFNNKGIDYLLTRVAQGQRDYPLGINLGKNLDTAVEDALSDYRKGFEKVYSQADYIALNVSSPNTPGLRKLQNEDELENLLGGIGELRKRLEDDYQYRRPVVVKLSPDLDSKAIPGIADVLRRHGIDGLIATNTTLSRDSVSDSPLSTEAGGLSGAALRDRSRLILSEFYRELGDDIPIISVGGIDSAKEAKTRFELGAKLIQLYSGLIFKGPGLVRTINLALQKDNSATT